jgi:predicted kinase
MTPKTIIFDLDGTLADLDHRLHFIKNGNKDWPSFYKAIPQDEPIQPVIDMVRHFLFDHRNTYRIVFCSGRDVTYRAETVAWLKKHIYPFEVWYDLLMRPANDTRPDDVVKQEMLDTLRREGHDIWFVVDDRQRVVDMWRANGITCLQAAPGDFDTTSKWAHSPTPGDKLLTIMVGPAGAGKSLWVKRHVEYGIFSPTEVISSDNVREEMAGDFKDQTQNERVFSYIHSAIQNRLNHGLRVLYDATNLKRRHRVQIARMAPKNTVVKYVVIDRPLEEKLSTRGWREEWLVREYHATFQSGKDHALRGDDLPNVIVRDLTED